MREIHIKSIGEGGHRGDGSEIFLDTNADGEPTRVWLDPILAGLAILKIEMQATKAAELKSPDLGGGYKKAQFVDIKDIEIGTMPDGSALALQIHFAPGATIAVPIQLKLVPQLRASLQKRLQEAQGIQRGLSRKH